MTYKLGEAVYMLDGISGTIIDTNYGGPCWQEKFGFISKNPAELRKWMSTVKNENLRRQNDSSSL